MDKIYTVAIIGAGIGRYHLEGYLALPDRYRVTHICDIDAERAQEVAALGQNIAVSTNYEDMLADPDIDVIDICLPPHLHVSTTIAAMEAGKHVICEKPIADSVADADKLIEVSKRTGKCFSPVFQYRFGLAMTQINALKAANLVGKPYAGSVETHWNRGADYYAVPWRGTWNGEKGGAVLSHVIHNHDLIGAIVGPISSVHAKTKTSVNPIEVEDCAAIIMETENGALITSSITLGGANDISRFRFCFEKVTMQSQTDPYAPCEPGWTYTARDPDQQDALDAVLARITPPHGSFAGYFEAFANWLDGKENAAIKPKDGRKSLELVSAIYHSSRTGELVTLPIQPDHPLYNSWQQKL
jgi:predicted dehydrogenase